jgi:hypothetical protein
MVVREMPLDRFKELLVGAACKLRPALTVSNPSPFVDHRHLT